MRHNHSIITKTAMVLLLTLLTAATAWAETVQTYYIDASGTRHDVTATVLTGTGNFTSNPNQWYVVNSDVTISNSDGNIDRYDSINLILADGKTFSISSSNTDGIICSDNGTLNIYGQENGTGTLNVTATGSSGNAIFAQSGVNIVGCNVTATTNSGNGIFSRGNITISGGQVSATGGNGNYGLYAWGTTTLGWRKTTDYVYASSYYPDRTVKVEDGQAFTDGTTTYSGTLNTDQISAIAGKTLTPDISGDFAHEGNTYTIHTAAGWDVFCGMLEGGESFSGKTVKLGADISVTRIAGSGAGGDLTASDHPFCGTFDGDGKTLTFNYGTSGTPANENNLAPFRYVNNATIQHLHVAGNIYTQHVHAGGIVGMAYGTTNITDCHSSVNIISSINGDGTHGGIMSCSWTGSTTNITGCLFDGSIQSASGYTTDQCGGFVGWKNATINVSNSLLTADLTTIGVGTGSYPSATFVRNGEANIITNSYYVTALGIAQGKAPRTVTAGDNVTVAVSPVGQPVANGTYSVSGITAYTKGITRTVGGATTFYYGEDDEVSLTLSNTPPSTLHTFRAYTATGGTLSGTENPYKLTMPDADVTIGAEWRLQPVTYLDADGWEHQCTTYTVLTGRETELNTTGWYVATGTVSYTGTVTLKAAGDFHFILTDGCQMNFGTEENRLNAKGIYYQDWNGSKTITIYGQTAGTGTLSIYTAPGGYAGIVASAVTINGGHIIANTTGNYCFAIGANESDLTINGGTIIATAGLKASALFAENRFNYNGGVVTATSGSEGYAINSNGDHYNFSWRNPDDHITIGPSDLDVNDGESKAYFNSLFTDGNGNFFSGTLTGSALDALAGKTLRPVKTAALASATIFDEDKYVGSFFSSTQNFQLPEGTLAYTASWDESNEKVVFHRIGEDSRVIPKNTAVIIVSDNESITFTPLSSTTVTPHAGNILQGSDEAIDKPTSGTVYVLGKDASGTLGFYQFNGDKIPAGKAYYVKQ